MTNYDDTHEICHDALKVHLREIPLISWVSVVRSGAAPSFYDVRRGIFASDYVIVFCNYKKLNAYVILVLVTGLCSKSYYYLLMLRKIPKTTPPSCIIILKVPIFRVFLDLFFSCVQITKTYNEL